MAKVLRLNEFLARRSCSRSAHCRSRASYTAGVYPFPPFPLYIYRPMKTIGTLEKARLEGWTDEEVVERVKDGDTALYEIIMNMVETSLDPEQCASRAELGQLLEEAVLGLPEQYRAVVILRDIEELSTSETAAALDLTEQNVKVRLHRGRAMVRGWLFARVGPEAKNAFSFMGVRCDRVVHSVF